ncbi:hypothetical protein F3Y22_tig00110258pilonHSYRG00106 [Hibiscus syriacus]|uniref:Agglutinin domain-containing protein n=1 Tax=Hibiscus syriacus TaxID=106335 RepID=A0A6A3B599_HIBSY|nr:uncharacterized protein LOC120115179 [Hibiscus syriacus]KAE8712294.1 hypothetical protein F3Y22_tig00110258pilonHSYRG00106 [Hibiscus syriacus]
MAVILPRFIVLGPVDKLNYLSYIRDGKDTDGYLRFFEDQAENPYAKFEVELSDTNGLVHIRSCQKNKYWVRTKNLSLTGSTSSQYWITATADKKEEDQSKESCTLFEFISVNPAVNTVRIRHVQSQCYLCLWRWSNPTYTRSVLANYKTYDGQSADIITIINWSTLLILPRYVAFKGNNDRYLCLRSIQGHPYLQFVSGDIGDSTVACEIIPTNDGNIRIKQVSNNKFWRRSPNWIWADTDDTSSNNKDTLFRPLKIDDKTISLMNLGNNRFCKRLTTEGKTDCLNAAVESAAGLSRLTVEEAIISREIYGINYSIENARVYDETVLVVARTSASNYTQESSTLQVNLSYTDTSTRTWKTNFSLTLGMKATMAVKYPFVAKGEIEISSELQTGVEWEETSTFTVVKGAVHTIEVPPMTKTTVSLVATQGWCDVPFTFMQRDTLYNGSTVISEVQGGTFTGANYSRTVFESKEEKLE